MTEQLPPREAAQLAGIPLTTFRRYRVRGTLPPADGYNGRIPYWHPDTILTWNATRRRCPRRQP